MKGEGSKNEEREPKGSGRAEEGREETLKRLDVESAFKDKIGGTGQSNS